MPVKVYYLDDEAGLCENFMDYFSSPSVEVTVFTDPAKAIESAKQFPPDLFFIDYRLPGTTGDKVAQATAAKIPKYLTTGDLAVKTEYKFKGIFHKPYNYEDISRVIDDFIKNKTTP